MTCHGAGICMHSESQPPTPSLIAESFKEKLEKEFNSELGCRIQRCISREHLEEDIKKDPVVLRVYTGEAQSKEQPN